MNNRNWTALPLILALLVASYLAVSLAAKAAETTSEDSEQVTKLFAETKTEAVELKEDALQVEMFARSQVSWQSHAGKLEEIRQHVNRAGRLLAQLNEARHTASPWQQKAIDSIHPLLKELADNVQATVEHFNNHKDHLQVSSYSDYVSTNSELATNLAALIKDYVDYAEHKAHYQRLQQKLQIAER
jgi:hypothetical protein